MQPHQPLLTIAIPTYNREQYLNELLTSLEPQIQAEPRIELIVSDNASTDGTEKLARTFVAKRGTFLYIRNETNLGAEANVVQCFEQACGKYVWIIGDDDIILPGAISKILAWIDSREYDLIYLSSFTFERTHDFSPPAERMEPSQITDVHIFVSEVNVFFTFISGNIVNKNRVMAGEPIVPAALIGSSVVQLGWMYAALNGYECGLLVKERLVAARINNTGSYKLIETFGPNLKRVTEERLHDKSLQRLILNGTIMRFWPGMLINYRVLASSFEKEDHPRKILDPIFRSNFRYWMFVYPILIAPGFLAKIWFFFTRILNRLDKAMGYPVMK